MDRSVFERQYPRRIAAATGRRPRILVVDDNADVRQLLRAAFEMEGHEVVEAATAREGLKRLEEAGYNLILTDYAMPGGTGTWMLDEAVRRGLMDRTVALVLTAHPDVGDLENVAVIAKPFDLDRLLDQVRALLDDDALRQAHMDSAVPYRVELVLYVSSASAASIQARRNLERLLTRFDGSQVKFTVCDLVRDPSAGDSDRIAFTPTLVKRYPEPRMWVVGNLKEPEIVADLLRACGVDANE
jgi:CheY-like chemotaxis protein